MVSPNEDYYAWTQETIEKLRQGKVSEVSMEDLIEELEDMGRSERRALECRLGVLLMHLLKWKYQPERRGRSWIATLKHQRFRALKLIKENPSLKSQVPTLIKEIYPGAVLEAVRETDMDEATFEETGWSWEQIHAHASTSSISEPSSGSGHNAQRVRLHSLPLYYVVSPDALPLSCGRSRVIPVP